MECDHSRRILQYENNRVIVSLGDTRKYGSDSFRRFGNTISLRNPSETSTTRLDPYSSNREIDYLRHTRVFKSVPK